jgi:hypothetical protein
LSRADPTKVETEMQSANHGQKRSLSSPARSGCILSQQKTPLLLGAAFFV